MNIRKSITVACPQATAFRVFCADIGKWWPKGPSFNNKDQLDITLEGRVGGRLYERYTDGSEFVIGRITVYQPPATVAFTWRAPSWEADTEVEVRFLADGDAGTRIELEHRGWEQNPKAAESVKSYDHGWDFVLGEYQRHVAGLSPAKTPLHESVEIQGVNR